VTRLRDAVGQRLTSILDATAGARLQVYRLEADTHELTAPETPGESAPVSDAEKPHVFVAMPYSNQMEDVFHYGIQGAVHACGYLCERLDHTVFVGGILDRIKQRIETAAVVVADLTGGNPNVCLEIGYAWGKARPTVLLADSMTELFFDVQGHRCLRYASIRDLQAILTQELTALKASGVI
jgi:hypothetical protein